MTVEPWQVPVLAMAISALLVGFASLVSRFLKTSEPARARGKARAAAESGAFRTAQLVGTVVLTVATLWVFVKSIGSENASALASLASAAAAAAAIYLAQNSVKERANEGHPRPGGRPGIARRARRARRAT